MLIGFSVPELLEFGFLAVRAAGCRAGVIHPAPAAPPRHCRLT